MGEVEQAKGYSKLSDPAKNIFKMIYNKHMKVCGKELKAKWIPAKVTEHRNYLKVYMHNGDWFHYYADGTWGVKTMGIGNEIRI